jgi:cytochrome P450
MSFVPFAGGKRVCIGKTFAEMTFKVIVPLVMKAFNKNGRMGEFVNKEHYTKKPEISATTVRMTSLPINFYA